MSGRRIEIGVLVVCVAALGFALFSKRGNSPDAPRTQARPRSALSALPRGANIAITVDFTRLKSSTFGELLLAKNRVIPGVGSLSEVCGFDPTERVREIAAGVPETTSADRDVGIALTGDFAVEPIIDCAARVVARRHGTPARTEIGSFVTLRDRENPSGEIAVKSGGPVLLGGGSYLREMVDTAEGKIPSLVGDEAHQTLRQSVGTDAELVASVVAKPGWLERWMGSDLAKTSPLARVRAGALRVKLEPILEAVVLLACPDEASCKELGALAEDLKKNLHQDVTRALGDDPVRSARVAVEKNAVRVTLTFDELVAAQLLSRLFSSESEPEPVFDPNANPTAKPDEVIRPAPSAGAPSPRR